MNMVDGLCLTIAMVNSFVLNRCYVLFRCFISVVHVVGFAFFVGVGLVFLGIGSWLFNIAVASLLCLGVCLCVLTLFFVSKILMCSFLNQHWCVFLQVMMFEEEFGLDIPDADAEKIFTADDAVAYVLSHQ